MAKKSKPKIVMTHYIHKEMVQKYLKPHAFVEVVNSKSQLMKKIRNADGIVTLLSDRVDENLIANGKSLKVIGNYAAGINNIDLKACKRKKITVVNTPDVLTRATAELTIALLFSCARRLYEGEVLCRTNRFKGWQPDLLLGLELKGRRAVLVGKGRIGSETAKLMVALGIKVEWITRKDKEPQIRAKLRRAQILSLHVPLSAETHHWLNKARLGLLPKDCIVLNTTRGPVVDERALVQALQKNRIFAAGFDVYEKEPSIPYELRKLNNVCLLPHLGSATEKTRRDMAKILVDGILSVLSGKHPRNEVRL
jgi:glyoxylate reductase